MNFSSQQEILGQESSFIQLKNYLANYYATLALTWPLRIHWAEVIIIDEVFVKQAWRDEFSWLIGKQTIKTCSGEGGYIRYLF
jgi:hypothetical protein